MARAVVTGVAGFIGSTLAEALLARGDEVVGVDCYTPYYARSAKEGNVAVALADPRFRLEEMDLRSHDLRRLCDGADVIYHQAAQPGVRLSWSSGFADYTTHNVLATQRLLEAAVQTGVRRFVYGSSSSVYGQAASYPTGEDDLPAPHSPYGVTKLAAEHLCNLYAANWGLPTVSLRYFTVYGPRQRPDMAIYRLVAAGLAGEIYCRAYHISRHLETVLLRYFSVYGPRQRPDMVTHRLVEAALDGEPFPLYGDGSAVRDFTFVDDVVRANLAAAEADLAPGTVMNIAGGAAISMTDLLSLTERLVGRPVEVDHQPRQPGDVARTGGTTSRARALLGWEPLVDLETGIGSTIAWFRQHVAAPRSESG